MADSAESRRERFSKKMIDVLNYGFDFSEEVILTARREAARKRLDNVEFVHLGAATLTRSGDYKGSFDYVTAFDSIHDQTQPLQAFKGIHLRDTETINLPFLDE